MGIDKQKPAWKLIGAGLAKPNRWRIGRDRFTLLAAMRGGSITGAPRAVAGRLRKLRTALLAATLAYVIVLATLLGILGKNGNFSTLELLQLLPAVIGGCIAMQCIMLLYGTRVVYGRLKASLEAAHFSICLECGYALAGLPRVHICPECGSRYDLTDVLARWKQWADECLAYK